MRDGAQFHSWAHPTDRPDAKLSTALEYARGAIERAAHLGVEVIVFGSPVAKKVPAGFPHALAWRQLVDVNRALGPIADQNNLTIALEHNNSTETNIATLATDALRLVREVGDPRIRLLIDFWHLEREHEDLAIVLEANSALRHVHIAEGDARIFPLEPRDPYIRFFRNLRQIQYSGRVSIEAFSKNFTVEARQSLLNLRSIERTDTRRQCLKITEVC